MKSRVSDGVEPVCLHQGAYRALVDVPHPGVGVAERAGVADVRQLVDVLVRRHHAAGVQRRLAQLVPRVAAHVRGLLEGASA